MTGAERFGADGWPADALAVVAVRSPHWHAAFTFGDLDASCGRGPGIVAVFTAADMPGRNRFGVIPPFADQPALAEGRARFRGEAVAIVAGEKGAIAGSRPRRNSRSSGASCRMRSFPAEAHGNGFARPARGPRRQRADRAAWCAAATPTAALAAAAVTVSGALETAFVEHAYIEPEAGYAFMDGDTLVISACTQSPYMDRDDRRPCSASPPDKVRIVPTASGGGFGSKLDVSLQPLIGLVALKTGRPAAWSIRAPNPWRPPPSAIRPRCAPPSAPMREGRVTGMVFSGDFNTGAYASWGPTVANRVPVHASGPYFTPAYQANGARIHTNGPVSGAFRGFGVPQATLMQETLYDELAEKLGIDRLEFRLINALPERPADGHRPGPGGGRRHRRLPRRAAPRWKRALAEARGVQRRQRTGCRRGVGVASCWYGCGNTALPNPSTIRIGITPAGRVLLHQGAVDIGQGSNTVIAADLRRRARPAARQASTSSAPTRH